MLTETNNKPMLTSKKKNILQELGFTPLGLGLLVLVALTPLYIDNPYYLHLIVTSLMFGALAMAFDFTVGYINIVNFGFAAFMGAGGYVSALLAINYGLSPWIGMFAAAAFSSILGFLTGLLTLRLRGMFAAIMAWFLGIVLMSLASNMVEVTRGPLGLNVPVLFQGAGKEPYLYTMFIVVILTYIVLKRIISSKIGLAFHAIGQDLEAAETSGINATKYKVLNFTVSCAFAGLIGAFYGHFVGILTPAVLHTRVTVEILALCYIGGRGSIWGGLLAAFLIIPIFESMRSLNEYRLIIYGLLLVLVMIYYPGGMAHFLNNAADYLKGLLPSKKQA
jgi:branched-chain amino acid transport system permease protein